MKNLLILPLLIVTLYTFGQSSKIIVDKKDLKELGEKFYEKDGKLFNGLVGQLLNDTDSLYLAVRNGIVLKKTIKKIGRNDGYVEYYSENGLINLTRNFVNNKFEGISKFYSEKGKVERVVNYHEGKREGSEISYFENGKIKDKWYYVNDKMEGRFDSYDEGGNISSIQNYKDGKLEGLFLVFIGKGVLSSITMYKNGEKNGVEEFYMNGKISRAITYVSNKQISVSDNPTKSIYQNTLKSIFQESNLSVIEEQSKSQNTNQSQEDLDKDFQEFLKETDKIEIQSSGVKVSPDNFSKGIPFASTINTASDKRYYTDSELKEANKPENIIGKPIKIGKLLVAQNEFPKKSDWKNAIVMCSKLGPGWRLPTKDELYVLYQNKNILRNFSKYGYWSSTEGSMNGNNGVAYFQDFSLGSKKPSLENKLSTWGVRAVKSL
jgi:antitoxin component YwqK of YwqJK toxin-antitoxin module